MSAVAAPASPDRARAAKRKGRRDTRMAYLLLLPYIVLLIMFGVFPVVYAFGLSFVDTIENAFYGLANYDFVFNDFRVPTAAINIIWFVVIWVAITMVGVATLSLMLDTVGRRTATTLRTIYFLPGAVTSSAVNPSRSASKSTRWLVLTSRNPCSKARVLPELPAVRSTRIPRSEEHTSELQSPC